MKAPCYSVELKSGVWGFRVGMGGVSLGFRV